MSEIKELREKMANLATEARSKLDEITDKTDEARAADIEREFDAMMTEHRKLEERLERLEALQRAEERSREIDTSRRPVPEGEARGNDDGNQAVSYRDAFHLYMRAAGQVGMLSPEERAVLQAGYAEIEQRAQTTGTNTAGGYTVPTEMQAILIKSMAAWGPMYDEDVCTVIMTESGTSIQLPTVNDTAKTGVASTEGTTFTDDGGADAVFGQKTLDAYSFNTEWLRVSLELTQDSVFAFEQLLGDLLGERLGRLANTQLTTGSGSSAPNGIVTATSAGKTTASNAAVTADEILDFVHSIDPAYRMSPKARIMFNDSTLLALRKLKDGQGNYLITEAPDGSGRMRVGAVSIPYSVNQAMASIGSATKPIVYGDFGKYFVRKVGDPVVGALQDKDFYPGFGVTGYVRFDGELGDTAAVKHLIMAV